MSGRGVMIKERHIKYFSSFDVRSICVIHKKTGDTERS